VHPETAQLDAAPSIPPVIGDSFAERRNRILAALGRLSQARSTEVIRATAPRELAEACDFTRAMISAIRGSRWVPLTLHSRADLDPRAAEFSAYVESDTEIPLANMLAETDVVRRRAAVLVDEHLVGTRAFKPIIEVARSPAYVVAPILVEGATIGFMHADRVGQPHAVDEDDRRHIQAFTGELAVLYQCASWEERLASRSRRATDDIERATDALRLAGVPAADLPFVPGGAGEVRADAGGGVGPGGAPAARADGAVEGAAAVRAAGATGVREGRFLTAREYEVLEHVAHGATNRVIAQRLSISEDTVKTHMRSVLRKLRVTSRAAAVARYLQLSGGTG
jgi:DNA-binding CsgD family transcriptional regulator